MSTSNINNINSDEGINIPDEIIIEEEDWVEASLSNYELTQF